MVKLPASIFIFPLALLAMMFGIVAGLNRISWNIPVTNIAGDHGALMTGSFIGTLICLERCITHSNKWWRLLPLINSLSILLFLLHEPFAAYVLLITGSFGLLVLLISYLKESPTLSNGLLILGAFAWLTGNLVLFNENSYPAAVKWWMLFLIWTIFGERLELSRMLPISKIKKVSLYIILTINLAGVLLPFHSYGNEIFAISLLALSVWLLLFDMSRFAFKLPDQHRYIASWLIAGYTWLCITSLWLLLRPGAPFSYDAALHSFFLGFVFSMIFGHVPIIFPGIFKVNISLYHPLLYVVFGIFQAGLVVRIAGDAFLNFEIRKWGAMMNGISILLFFTCTVIIVITRMKKRKKYVSTGR